MQVLASQYRKDIKNIKMCPKEGNKHENTYQLSKEMGKGAHLLLGFFLAGTRHVFPMAEIRESHNNRSIKCFGVKCSCYCKQPKAFILLFP